MPLPNMTPAQLLAGAQAIADRAPDAELVKNEVGNLAIVRDGMMIGWLDLRDGTPHFDGDEGQWRLGETRRPASPARLLAALAEASRPSLRRGHGM